nr:hypothetical protein [Chamaesiphon polymorphus]
MPVDRPLQIDALHTNSFNPLLPKPPILSSQLAGWDRLHLIYHRQSPYSIPETVPAQHTINIYTTPVLAQVKIDGRWQQRSGMVGDIGIFPAQEVVSAAEFLQELGIVHLYLDPVSLSNVAFESIDPDRIELIQQLQVRDPLIQQLGLSLKQELETSATDSRLYAESVATMLAVHLLKRYSVRQPIIPVPTGGLSNYSLKTLCGLSWSRCKSFNITRSGRFRVLLFRMATIFRAFMGTADDVARWRSASQYTAVDGSSFSW